MITLPNKSVNALASKVRFTDDMLYILLMDGREIGVPLLWFPKLRQATKEQLENWRLIGKGIGIHWEDLDEDLSVSALLNS
jgi:hypothetical protein